MSEPNKEPVPIETPSVVPPGPEDKGPTQEKNRRPVFSDLVDEVLVFSDVGADHGKAGGNHPSVEK